MTQKIKKLKKDILIKFSLPYLDGSGERMSLEINTKEKDSYQVKINDEKIWCSIEELIWLREHIDKSIYFINKNNKNE